MELCASQQFEIRRLAVDADARVRRFWLALDERVHPMTASAADRPHLDRVSQWLFQRLELRIHAARIGIRGELDRGGLPPRTRASLSMVSALVMELHQAHLRTEQGADLMDWALLQFASFAAGTFHPDPKVQIALELHGVPNSSEYLKLPELGFAARDHGIDCHFWRPHLVALVRSAECFVASGGRAEPGTARLIGCAALDYRPGRTLDARARLELERQRPPPAGEWDAEQRFEALLAATFPDTQVGALG